MRAALVMSPVETATSLGKTDSMTQPPKGRSDCNRRMAGSKAIAHREPEAGHPWRVPRPSGKAPPETGLGQSLRRTALALCTQRLPERLERGWPARDTCETAT